jgi:hypothetical protein
MLATTHALAREQLEKNPFLSIFFPHRRPTLPVPSVRKRRGSRFVFDLTRVAGPTTDNAYADVAYGNVAYGNVADPTL